MRHLLIKRLFGYPLIIPSPLSKKCLIRIRTFLIKGILSEESLIITIAIIQANTSIIGLHTGINTITNLIAITHDIRIMGIMKRKGIVDIRGLDMIDGTHGLDCADRLT